MVNEALASDGSDYDDAVAEEEELAEEAEDLLADEESEEESEESEEEVTIMPAATRRSSTRSKSAPKSTRASKTPPRSATRKKKAPPPRVYDVGQEEAEDERKETDSTEKALDELVSRFNTMKMKDDGLTGFCFDCIFPYIWYSYKFGGVTHTVYDFLMWTCDVEDCSFIVNPEGTQLHVSNKITDRLFQLQRHAASYGIAEADRPNHLYYQSAVVAQNYISEQLGLQKPRPGLSVDLPHPCQQQPHDPYAPEAERHRPSIKFYPHESQAVQIRVCIVTCVLRQKDLAVANNQATSGLVDIP